METLPTRDFRRLRPFGALAGELSGTLKVRKPADATLNVAVWRGGCWHPPSTPKLRAPMSEDRTEGGVSCPEPP